MTDNTSVHFDWDPAKNQANIKKHDYYEDRIITIEPIVQGVVTVVTVERDEGEIIRIISARSAKTAEIKRYTEEVSGVSNE